MARLGRGYPVAMVLTATSAGNPTAVDLAYATDTVTGALSLAVRTATDSAPATDVAGRAALTLVRSATDSAPAVDTIVSLTGKFVFDTAPATDTASRAALLYYRSATDTAAATDTARAFYPRSVIDSAPATDVAGRTTSQAVRTAADTAAATDTMSRTLPLVRNVFDSAPATDVASRTTSKATRTATDTAPATDSAGRTALHHYRTAADTAGADDTVSYFVVGTGGATQIANPNWPIVGFDVDFSTSAGPPDAPPGPARQSIDAPYRRLTVRRFGIKRGRQYELDQVQTGTAQLEIVDPLEVLNPDNSGSPFNATGSKIVPYRPFWQWAIWPNQPGSGNLLNEKVTLGADPSFESGTGCLDGMVSGTGTFVQTAAQAYSDGGTHSVLVTQTAAGSSYGVYGETSFITVPGITYVASAWVRPTGGCTVSMTLVDGAGALHAGSPASIQNVWQRIYVPFTAVDTLEQVVIFGTGTTTPTFYVDSMQLEFGPTPHTFTYSGPTLYPLFTGYVERFPTTYDMDGYRAIRPLEAVDGLALLALADIAQSYSSETAKDFPQFTMPLDDKAGPPAVHGNPAGFGSFTNNSGGQIEFSGDSLPDGTAAAALTQQIQQANAVVTTTLYAYSNFGAFQIQTNDNIEAGSYIQIEADTQWEEWAQVTYSYGTVTYSSYGVPSVGAPYILGVTLSPFGIVGLQSDHVSGGTVVSYAAQDTVINTSHHASYSVNFAGATFEGWFKPTAGDITMLLAGENLSGAVHTWSNTRPVSKRDTFIGIQSCATGLNFVLNDSKNGPSNWLVPATPHPDVTYAGYPDGQWHYYAVKIYANPANANQYLWSVYVDQVGAVAGPVVGSQAMRRVRFNELVTAASTYTGAPQSVVSAAQLAYYPYALSDDRILAHAQRGMGNKGEATVTRVSRLLAAYWGGPVLLVGNGNGLAMADDFTYDPTVVTETSTSGAGQNRAMLDVLQEIQETERGLVYANLRGAIIFEDRTARYLSQTSLATLGEDPTNAGAELPYEAYETDFDPTYTFSQANLTSPYNGDFLPLINPSAVTQVGNRVLTQQLQVVSDFDLEQAGIFYLTRYGTTRTRITKITLKPSANPALWPVCLAMEISQRYTVHRRSQTGVDIVADYYVESVSHNADPESGDWTTELQMSPVFVSSAWVLGDPVYGVLGTTTTPVY